MVNTAVWFGNMDATKRKLINALRNRKKNWIGHVLRGEGLLKEGNRGKGKEKA